MKLRLWPILLSVVISSVVLFGGWFLYDSLAVQQPLDAIVRNVPGVESAETTVGDRTVLIRIKPKPDSNLREIYQTIVREGGETIGNREVKLEVVDTATPELNRWWSSALFDVAEAMETRRYSEIPAALEAKKGTYPGLSVDTEMDDKNVYVHLTDGSHEKYVILPRIPERLGLWPNE